MRKKEMFRKLEEAYQLISEAYSIGKRPPKEAMNRIEQVEVMLGLSSEEMEKLTQEVIDELYGD